MNHLTFILGGARSGKSRFALDLGNKKGSSKIYLATAQPLDDEMALRIKKHRRERDTDWQTVEEPIKLTATLQSLEGKGGLVVIDCLTLWLSNLLMDSRQDDQKIMIQIEELIRIVAKIDLCVIAVSNEVGLGIVPSDPLSRRFRDLSGSLHQQWAEIAHEVYWMTAGIPMKIKGGS